MSNKSKWPSPLHRLGYTSAQVIEICGIEKVTREQLSQALGPITMAYETDVGLIMYPHDVELGIDICHRGTPMTVEEWD